MGKKIRLLVVFIINLSAFLMAVEVVIDRLVVTHQDQNYVRNVNVTVRRLNRKSPYLIFCKMYIVSPMGNNVTICGEIFQNLSGRYKPIPITFTSLKWKLCDFYEKVSIGQMLARQFKQNNYSCPFPIGPVEYPAIEVQLERVPMLTGVFTFLSKTVNVRFDMNFGLSGTEKKFLAWSVYSRVTLDSTNKSKGTARLFL